MEPYNPSSNLDEANNKNPKPILITPSQSRKSISGIDFLNGLKIITNTSTSHHDTSTPSSPVPSQQEQYHFNHIEDFDMKEVIGYGSSAIVYKAIYKPLNKCMALKMIDLDKFERNQIDELRRETALMALSKHTNVLKVYGSFVHGSKLYIVTPYLAGGSCLDIMKTRFPEGLDEFSIATILKQTLEALIYLHKNGHIHRDVKAGNLLMDEDGTVLLGDFGVSSSLMETGQRGMRKTFVGTPCWMAPEVMEQAEYDYKADIWSFGITAIELATGHAPFAKFPPLKVLMMTLSNEPPTLDRDTTFHKYSKTFKDMIDSCLSKDPLKRPSADKLIQHPFFKQAKRKEYLVKYILAELPPLEQRPRKQIPQKQIIITKSDEWDFGDTDEEEDTDHNNIPEQNLVPTQQPQENINKSSSSKKHISFGDVIVRTNSLIHPADTVSSGSPPLPANISSTPPRKSRFVIEESSETYNSSSVRSSSPSTTEDDHHTTTSDHSGEIMKGRFYVNQQKTTDTEEEQPSQIYKVNSQDSIPSHHSDRKSRFEVSSSPFTYQPIPLSRDNSSYSSTSTAGGKPMIPTVEKKPLHHQLQQSSSSSSTQDYLTAENVALLTESSRKIGRFELTSSGSSSVDITPRGSISSSHNEHAHHQQSLHQQLQQHQLQQQLQNIHPHQPSELPHQLEELLRMNESQKLLLQEISSNFKRAPLTAQPLSTQNTHNQQSDYFYEHSIQNDLHTTVEHLEKLIQQTLLENAKLQKENESLRRELKELKNK